VAFLEHWKEAGTMSDVQYAPVQEAMKRLEQLSLSQEERFRALARERALLDEATLRWEATEGKAKARREGVAEGLAEGRMEGRAEGVTEGRVEGRSRAKAETLTRLLTHRFGALPDWAGPLIDSASETQLDAWLDGIFEAQSMRGLIAPGE
jgi:flagellar biosynthesis/type III secretory pathway protein FliH